MEKLKKYIDIQLAHNRGKNLFYGNIDLSLGFVNEISQFLNRLPDSDTRQEEELIDYITDSVLRELCLVNQFYGFGKAGRKRLRVIYSDLLNDLRRYNEANGMAYLKDISDLHYSRLQQLVADTNSFATEIYSQDEENTGSVPCSEYSPELQVNLFRLDIEKLAGPLLDIGCGKMANLVTYLRDNGVEAFGIDRFARDIPFCENADWLEFDYGTNRWGTIISNLGFSNHFMNHHLRKDGNWVEYSTKYMEILGSLKPGGSFYYSPGLPFIESYLDKEKYHVTEFETGIYDFRAVSIRINS